MKRIIEFSEVEVKKLGRLLSPLFGQFQNGCVGERSLMEFPWMILIDLVQLVYQRFGMQKLAIELAGRVPLTASLS